MDVKDDGAIVTRKIEISGLVQGVGFRPFIHRLALAHQLNGLVENRSSGVHIIVSGPQKSIEQFRLAIRSEAPPASDIEQIQIYDAPLASFTEFSISGSREGSDTVTEISPDIAVCEECLSDMQVQEQRIDYPFVNCTNCGPRFSIIRELPYDRPNTSMAPFMMCPECRKEYENIRDRRFHAQPVACKHCGPGMQLDEDGMRHNSMDMLLEKIRDGLKLGKVYAIKGMGGFHLMCDAFNEKSIAKLREIKKRDGKPFALMFRSIEEAEEYVEIDDNEKKVLNAWQRPIVLLKKKQSITPGIADGLSSLGVMLPYMPFHYLLFREIDIPALVLTSGNFSDEPILICNTRAHALFENFVDGIISYNREIINRNDDSVSTVINGKPQIIRRSRGYAPSPIRTHLPTEGIFAAGAELVSSFCMGKGKNAMMSQYIGDLKNFETLAFYEEVYTLYSKMFRFKPELIVHDLHPDYLSTKFAIGLSERLGGIPLLAVQHHHAHIASVMLANGLDGEVIGISLDGMGLGDDGKIWGAEIMLADYANYKRMYHFGWMPLPGGDKASKQAWRMAVSYLYSSFGNAFLELPLPLLKEIDRAEIGQIMQMIDKGVNTPMISSAGRLFDAVSAILGLNFRASYQAEAPMRLESAADTGENGRYTYEVRGQEILFQGMVRDIVSDYVNGCSVGTIAGKFHNTLVEALLDLVLKIKKAHKLNRVILSGGSFQNRILTENLVSKLSRESLEVYLPGKIPVNDQGIALGQLAIGAARRI